MSIVTIIIILLALALLGVLPIWRHSGRWGFAPSGVFGVVLVVLVIMVVAGRL
ncbi:DUF3309 family protein [Sandarakinorhabdus oryzae]|uniref:DUF3309 family protein n=1 Tax=Sandarakinorhabdus oryzae TaxID=2675220 RepID=UPI0012E1C07B|nr:DUF3309 family protein [Sandarakinorhabdus oryzae]